MNTESLMSAAQELLAAQNEEEFNSALQKHPELLSEEIISHLEASAKRQTDLVNFLHGVAQMRGDFSPIQIAPENFLRIFVAFQQELATARTDEESQAVLQKYPEMLSQTVIRLLADSAATGQQITDFLRQRVQATQEAGIWQPQAKVQPIISEPTVRWAELARKYLALQRYPHSENFLVEAIKEAKKIKELEIVEVLQRLLNNHKLNREIRKAEKVKNELLLQTFINQYTDNLNNLLEKALRLLETYVHVEKYEANITLRLIYLNNVTSHAEIPPTIDEQAYQDYQIGMKSCEDAIYHSKLLNDEACQAHYLVKYGVGFFQWRRWKHAEIAFMEALRIFQKLAKTNEATYESFVAMTLNNLGNVLREMRRLAKAETVFKEALRIFQELAKADKATYESFVAMTLSNLGNVLINMRHLSEAETAYNEALRIDRKLAETDEAVYESNVAKTLINLGTLLRDMERLVESETAFMEALRIFQKLAKTNEATYESFVAMTLNSLGTVLRKMERLSEAETAYKEALRIRKKLAEADKVTFEFDVAQTLNNLGNILIDMRHLSKAETAYNEALRIRKKLAETDEAVYDSFVAMTLYNLGNLLCNRGKTQEAKEKYQEAVEIWEKRDFPVELSKIYSSLGEISLQAENWQEAADLFDKAIGRVEQLRTEEYEHLKDQYDEKELSEERHKRNDYIRERAKQILAKNFTAYEGKFVALMKLGREKEAIEVSEKGKSRTINDLLFQRAQGLTGSAAIYCPTDKTKTVEEINKLAKKNRKTIISFRITQNYGSYAFVNFPDGDLDVIFIEDFNAQDLSDLMVKYEKEQPVAGWLFRYSKYIELIRLRMNYMEADRNKDELRKDELSEILRTDEWLQNADAKWFAEMEKVLGELDKQLMSSIRWRLQEKASESKLAINDLVIIPNRALAILPLHACWWLENGERKYWIDDYTITYAPSLAVYQTCWEREQAGCPKEKILAISNPSEDLMFSEQECEEIQKIFGRERCEIVNGKQATKAKIVSLVNERNWLHFSCHGVYNFAAPFESFLQLADVEKENDGNLRLQEIMEQLSLNHTWLTVLSACETGLSEFFGGVDEYYGLPLGFLLGGVPSVWGTLWSVRDDATKELLVRAYNYLNDNLSKPEALRSAQKDLRDGKVKNEKGDNLSHPYFWAGIQSFGV